MAHQSLKKLIKKAIDSNQILSKQYKSKLKREIDAFPDCVSFNTIRQHVQEYIPLSLKGGGNDPSYKMHVCGTQAYCSALKELGRCNKRECFFENHY